MRHPIHLRRGSLASASADGSHGERQFSQQRQPLHVRQFTFTEIGPLGIVFGDVDLAGESVVVVNAVRPGSMASQHVGLVAGWTVHAVQGCVVDGETFDEVLARIKAAGCARVRWHRRF